MPPSSANQFSREQPNPSNRMRTGPSCMAQALVVILLFASLVSSSSPSPILQILHPSKRSTTTAAPVPENNSSATTTTTTTSPSHTWIESILIQVDRVNGATTTNNQAEDEPNLTSSSSLAPTDSGEEPLETATDLNQDDDDDERRLVESNNVKTVASAARPGRPEAPQPPAPRPPLSCNQAYTQCALRRACAPALKAYNDHCRELVHNKTSQCSPRCLRALVALRSSEEGDDLIQCDCQGDQYCESSKQRSQACRPQVELAVDPKTQVACSTASWICMADQLCSTAFEYYYRNCQTLFTQRHCSLYCNNSLAVLYRQPKAKKLINCQCDGSEDFPCVKYKTLTERLCLGQSPSLNNNIHGHSEVEEAQEEENEEENEEEDEEGQLDSPINMTNDFFNTHQLDGPNSDHANDQETDDSTQLPEDNWIPLMTGRYFTNLHQQEQQQVIRKGAHQQQHKRIGKQRAKPTTNSRPREPQQTTISTGRRRRILALGSSASSASSTNWLPLMSFVSTWWLPCVAFASVVFVSTILCKLPTR